MKKYNNEVYVLMKKDVELEYDGDDGTHYNNPITYINNDFMDQYGNGVGGNFPEVAKQFKTKKGAENFYKKIRDINNNKSYCDGYEIVRYDKERHQLICENYVDQVVKILELEKDENINIFKNIILYIKKTGDLIIDKNIKNRRVYNTVELSNRIYDMFGNCGHNFFEVLNLFYEISLNDIEEFFGIYTDLYIEY